MPSDPTNNDSLEIFATLTLDDLDNLLITEDDWKAMIVGEIEFLTIEDL